MRPNTKPNGLLVSRGSLRGRNVKPATAVALKRAREDAGLKQTEAAAALRIDTMTLSRYERGLRQPLSDLLAAMATLYRVPVAQLLGQTVVSRETVGRDGNVPALIEAGWPKGWNARAYRLQLEAAEAGATEDELAAVRGWMLDPQVQAMWSGGAPKADQLKSLDGIEIGARAWLRARGRMVKVR